MAGGTSGRTRPPQSGEPARSVYRRNPKAPFGRRESDLDAQDRVTRKLVILTVVLVDALYLAGDTVLFGHDKCL